MSKTNKYKIYYFNNVTKRYYTFAWRIAIEKLNLIIGYSPRENHFVNNNFIMSSECKILNNFIIEPELVTMLKSKDKLTINVAFEILNNRLNERTK